MMQCCDKNHTQVAFQGTMCPMCDAMEKMKTMQEATKAMAQKVEQAQRRSAFLEDEVSKWMEKSSSAA